MVKTRNIVIALGLLLLLPMLSLSATNSWAKVENQTNQKLKFTKGYSNCMDSSGGLDSLVLSAGETSDTMLLKSKPSDFWGTNGCDSSIDPITLPSVLTVHATSKDDPTNQASCTFHIGLGQSYAHCKDRVAGSSFIASSSVTKLSTVHADDPIVITIAEAPASSP